MYLIINQEAPLRKKLRAVLKRQGLIEEKEVS